MLILGKTADDKGAQLEALIRTVLEQQGYKRVRSNVVGAGGNELDVIAVRETPIVGARSITPLMCEAKAYADPVNMPVWQRFLGKLFIERVRDPTAVGILMALNGINGNVAGSYESLRSQDTALFVFEGSDLEALASKTGELAEDGTVLESVQGQYQRLPSRAETAYYGGAFYWVLWWNDDLYSVVAGHGQMLSPEGVENLRPALEATLSGSLLATNEAKAEAEARHQARLKVLNRLLRGEQVRMPQEPELTSDNAATCGFTLDELAGVESLSQEPFCRVEGGKLRLLSPAELDADAVSRLFLSIFENVVKVALLRFMVDRLHEPYVHRLVELLPEFQEGLTLSPEDAITLREVAVLFPSVWVTIAQPIPIVTTHRADVQDPINDRFLASDRASLWEAVIAAIRADYSNPVLRGFLYDFMGIAELQERGEFIVKAKDGPVGQPIKTDLRNAVRQFAPQSIGQADGPIYIMLRLLAAVPEPWEDQHPDPVFPLGVST